MARNRNKLQAQTRRKLEQIVRLAALDKAPREIGSLLGMSDETVTDLMSTEHYRKLETAYTAKTFKNVDELIEKRNASYLLEEAAPDAAEALTDLLNDIDPTQRRLAATAVLDRAGHGPVQRRAVRHRHELDPVSATLLKDAMRGSMTVDVDAIEVEIAALEPHKDESKDNA